jgi:formate dehydrogenase (coenzyme F420) beta subunit
MNVNRVLQIQDGHTVSTLQNFLAAWWKQVDLDAMLAPVETADHGIATPRVITRPADLRRVNPFTPVMLSNTAPMVQDFVKDYPHSHLAVILRPCELRAMVELSKRHRVRYQPLSTAKGRERLVVIGVDCPGTYSQPQRVAGDGEMIHVGVTYGRQESYIPHQVRQTCQMCDSPGPFGADITIGTIGVEPEGKLLIIAPDEKTDVTLLLKELTDGIATEREVVHREMMVGKLVDKRAEKRAALMKNTSFQVEEVGSILAMFARCTLCADCLDACPLYDGELSGMLGVDKNHRNHSLLAEVVRVSRWLASCSGCGMCRESCPHGVPLAQVVTALSHRIQNELHYRPGDPSQPLPWAVGK